jgi:putative NIF3 family GTP cyclohydrolase 1 type 2
MGLSTQEIMDRSLALVGWDAVPADSTIYVPGEDLETALVGIDLGSAELQLAAREGYDLALAHHPAGDAARLGLPDVLDRQVELMTDHGVPADAAEAAVASLRNRVDHGAHASNFRHDPSVAELLGQPFMNVHLAPDEIGRRRFAEVADGMADDATLAEFADALEAACPALRAAPTDVEVRVGRRDNRLGEVAVHHGAGTNGGAEVARAYFDHGVDTVVYIHVSASDTEELREAYYGSKNLVITGHIASDAVGMNALIDDLESAGLDCTCISGTGLGR